MLGELYAHDPLLKRPYSSSIFPASSYNLGPRTVCFRHTDYANLPFGWCAITSLGSFDPEKGGHLILWDCHLVVEFPPGSTVLIPSAIISHSNIKIQAGETRYSFTQYAAGGLFRWVEHGFQTNRKYYSKLSKEEHEADMEQEAGRWKSGLSLFSTLDSLKKYYKLTASDSG